MKISSLYSLRPGTAHDEDGHPMALSVHDLGTLHVPSGRVRACDPFVTLDEGPVFEVPPGDYPVRVAVADVSQEQDGSHLREAYLSLVLAEGEAATVEPAASTDGVPEPGTSYGVGVDAGAVGLVDADAVERCMPEGDWYDNVFDNGEPTSWFNIMDSEDHYQPGCANIIMPLATDGENVVLSHSGWGDGWYPVRLTRDAAGTPLALHIDLLVADLLGVDDPQDDDED